MKGVDPITYELPDSDPATWPRISAWLTDDDTHAAPLQFQGITGRTAHFEDCPSKSGGGAGSHKITFVLR